MKIDLISNHSMRIRKRSFLLLICPLCISCGILLFGCGPKKTAGADEASSSALPVVAISTARLGVIEQTLPVTGTLNALRDREATITPSVAGIIDTIAVKTGDTVAKGQLISSLSTRQLIGQIDQAKVTIAQNEVQEQQAQANVLQQQAQAKTGIAQAEAALSQAKAALRGAQANLTGNEAALKNAKQNLDRERSLEKDGLVARKDVEAAELAAQTAQAQVDSQKQTVDAQSEVVSSQVAALDASRSANLQTLVKRKDVKVAQLQLKNAKTALATAQSQLALYTLKSPLSGVVASVGASAGESIDTATKIAVVSNIDTLQLQISVPADSTRNVHVGEIVRFWTDSQPGKTFTAVIRTVGTEVDPSSNTIQALALVANKHRAFSDGMFVRAQIILSRHRNSCLVPKSAIQRNASGQQSIAVLASDSTIHVANITTGVTTDSTVEVLSGVRPGQKVVTTGGYGLPDGSKATTKSDGATQ